MPTFSNHINRRLLWSNKPLFLHENGYDLPLFHTGKVCCTCLSVCLSVFFQYDEGRKDYDDERGSYRGDKDSYDDRERDRDYRERKRWDERERKRSDDYRCALGITGVICTCICVL